MNVQLTQNQIVELVSEANRAPSVHNVQPSKWAWTVDQEGSSVVTLYSDQTRRLHVGDPLRLDEGTSLGASWEGLRIALDRRGLDLHLLEWMDPSQSPAHPIYPHLKPVAIGKVARKAAARRQTVDSLSEYVLKRKSYRGKFKPATRAQITQLSESLDSNLDLLITDRAQILKITKLISNATSRLSKHLGAQKELLQWLRFSPADEGYYEDGINAEALALSKPLARLAKSALQIATHPIIFKMGLTRVLTDETSVVKSSSAILILFTPLTADPLTRGRHLYRTWLKVTRAGLSACPMSAVADDPGTQNALKKFHPAPELLGVLNVLRIGLSPEPLLPLTPRLQPEKLITL